MKIGLLTFHCAHNYGAVLQAYSLQQFLQHQGHDVEFIDYRPDYLIAPYAPRITLRSVRDAIGSTLRFPRTRAKQREFDSFIGQYLRLSPSSYTEGGFSEAYDAYVIGSDQVWNESLTRNDDIFFGRFNRAASSKLLAYAASTEVKSEGERIDLSHRREDLALFDAIGVREDALREHLCQHQDGPVSTVLDPTLLVPPATFTSITPKIGQSGHILTYQVKPDPSVKRVVTHISRERRLSRSISITSNPRAADLLNRFSSASPLEFLALIKQAAHVVTTSFHGVAFSIIFRRPFTCIINPSRGNIRISNLLNIVGLTDRMIYGEQAIPSGEIDFDSVHEILQRERARSSEFLLRALT